MEEGLELRRSVSRRKIVVAMLVFYVIAVPVYLYFGLQPSGNTASAYAEEAKSATGSLEIPSIDLKAPMADAELNGRALSVPKYIVGRYRAHDNKALVMGHSSTIFQRLKEVNLGEKVVYDGQDYEIISREIKAKAEISMKEILKDEAEPTLVLMTCFGEHLSGQDYSHRLIIYAKRV